MADHNSSPHPHRNSLELVLLILGLLLLLLTPLLYHRYPPHSNPSGNLTNNPSLVGHGTKSIFTWNLNVANLQGVKSPAVGSVGILKQLKNAKADTVSATNNEQQALPSQDSSPAAAPPATSDKEAQDQNTPHAQDKEKTDKDKQPQSST